MRYTKKQLKAFEESTMIIYLIHNKKNRKSYVGQTVLTFNKRYGGAGVGAQRVVGHTNQKLQQDLEKYGPDNFKVTLLEENVESIEKLNELEKHYIKVYDGATKGYNTLLGGNNYDKNEFYQIRRDIRKVYLDVLTLNNALQGVECVVGNGLYVQMAEVAIESSTGGLLFDLQLDVEYNTVEHYKQYAMDVISSKLQKAKDLGFNLTLQDVLEFYNL